MSGKGTRRIFCGARGGSGDDSVTSILTRYGVLIRILIDVAKHNNGGCEEAFTYAEVGDFITPIKVN